MAWGSPRGISSSNPGGKHDGRYAYITPEFNQAKDIAWTYLFAHPSHMSRKTPSIAGRSETQLLVRRLLRARRERPCRRSAEKRDELAAFCMTRKEHCER
jgi:hypothetical protein